MKLFALLILILIILRIIKPQVRLYEFNSQSTLPLRGILAVFIMFHHVSQRYDFSFDIPFLIQHPSFSLNLFRNMGAPVVGVFFLLTGYGLAKSLQLKKEAYLSGFIKKRLST